MEPPDAEQRAARTRRLYRYISEAIRKVDEGTSRAKTVFELFSSSLEIHRQKLRENCEKLIFADPLIYGRKAQELLWRKGYYEAVSTAKRLHATSKNHIELVLTHILSGIGHYHNLISRIQMEMDVSVADMLDYPIVDIKCDLDDSKREELIVWAKSAIQICLVNLGDLSRYKSEYEDSPDNSMSVRYYFQASGIDPKIGMPFNQLGTLHTGKYHSLDSVRYYIICLSCESPFDGAEGNLVRIFDRNNKYLEMLTSKPAENTEQQESIKTFICKFLSLVDCWYFDKNLDNFNEMCTSALYELKECLQFTELNIPDKNTIHTEIAKHIKEQEYNPDHLNFKIINKIVLIIFLCINKLEKENSPQLFSLKAFALAFLSQMLHKLLSILIEMGFEVQSPEQIVEERKERMKNYKNVKGLFRNDSKNDYDLKIDDLKIDAPIENGDEVKEDLTDSSVERKNSITKEEEADETENKDAEKQEEENKESELDKSVKIKNKKNNAKILRRRKRRLNSIDSIEDSESETSPESSDLEDKMDEDESESDNDNASDGSYFTYSSSDENEYDENQTDEPFKAKSAKSPTNGENENGITNGNDDDNSDTNFENNSYSADKVKFNEDLVNKFLETNDILAIIKLLLNWLHTEADFLYACRFNGRAFFQTLVDILNIVNRQIFPRLSKNTYSIDQQYHPSLYNLHEAILGLKYRYKSIPLPEDYDIKSIDFLKPSLKDVKWDSHKELNLSEFENNAVRFLSFIDFGVFIVKLKIGIIFNRRLKMYTFKRSKINKRSIPNVKKFNKDSENFNSKILKQSTDVNGSTSQSEGLMRNLGKLWLSAQVRELESEVRAGKHQHGLPAYVVVDAEALSKHTYLIKRLVSSKKLIVLIPSIVLQVMDELKKESGGARSAIRWLEFQLRNGSRFLRTQRSTETASIPNVKYPKKMPRDMHNFIQILEFCYYLLSQENNFNYSKNIETESTSDSVIDKADSETNGENTDNCKVILEADRSNVLVMLTGSRQSESPDSSESALIGFAKLAGVPIENIQDYCVKLKTLFSKTGKYR